MSTMNVSLPDQMKNWIESRIEIGEYHNASEYVRDLIRRDRDQIQRDESFRQAIQAGRDSDDSDLSFRQITQAAIEQAHENGRIKS